MRSDQPAVVGGRLKARSRRGRPRSAKAIREAVRGIVELVVVRRRSAALGRRRDQTQRRRSLELLRAEDAAVEGPEAHAAAAEPEALGERPHWDEVVVATLQLTDMVERDAAQLDVTRIPHAR